MVQLAFLQKKRAQKRSYTNYKVYPKEIKNQSAMDSVCFILKEYTEPEELTDWEVGYNYNEGEETFFLNEKLGYQLSVVDAALGTRFYNLLQTTDSGENWELHNPDPFLGKTGGAAGISFIDESLGFIALSRFAGTQAYLYRTIDGGISYEQIELPTYEVLLGENDSYDPFVFPTMPYEEDGKLFMLVGQGQDGDYKGGIDALFQSEDRGETWTFVHEMERTNSLFNK